MKHPTNEQNKIVKKENQKNFWYDILTSSDHKAFLGVGYKKHLLQVFILMY